MRLFRLKTSQFRKGPLPFRYVLLISFILFIILVVQGIWFVNKNIQPTLIKYAEVQSKRVATAVMTKAVKDRIEEGFDVDSLMKVKNDRNGNVSTIDVNTKQVNEILTSTTTYIENYLHAVEEGDMKAIGMLEKDGITMSIPLGRITDNALIGNMGPDIPVQFTTVGHVYTDIKQKFVEHGINNTAIQVVMEVEVALQVLIPLHAKEVKVRQEIPIATKIVQGKVPDYYGGSGGFVPDKKVDE
ncbi:sporulation protein YunB [Bacillus manliponensis]|uniref:sporulation protein YunB n=1 Tax=Bacillus manliponensis TaxID=574376 RepID=UPI0035169ADB